jgi:hypothetical protein
MTPERSGQRRRRTRTAPQTAATPIRAAIGVVHAGETKGWYYLTYSVRMKISEKIKRLFHREPPTEGELEARAEAAASRAERAADLGEAELLTRKPG